MKHELFIKDLGFMFYFILCFYFLKNILVGLRMFLLNTVNLYHNTVLAVKM